MRGKWFGATLVAAILITGCGQGHATFDVDVYSWLKGTGKDTISYGPVPPGVSNFTVSNTPQKINLLPGAGSSAIDTVRITGTMDVRNQTGSGTIALQFYLAGDSTGTYSSSAAIFNPAPSASVSGTNTSVITFTIPNLSARLDSLFTKSEVWVRMLATVSNTGLTNLQGQGVLTSLSLRLVVQDKIF